MWVISSADLQLFFLIDSRRRRRRRGRMALFIHCQWMHRLDFLGFGNDPSFIIISSSSSAADDEIHSRRIYISSNLGEGPTSGFLTMWHSVCHGNLASLLFSPFLALLVLALLLLLELLSFCLQEVLFFWVVIIIKNVRVSCQNRKPLFGLAYQGKGYSCV